jgi:adenylate kinase
LNILLFGAPGSGKGTQSAFLVHDLGMTHVSTGDIFREEIKRGTSLGKEAKTFMDKGELVPDRVVIDMVEGVLKSLGRRDFILDGFPRTVVQAEALNEMLLKNGLNLDKAIFLEVPRAELIQRLTGRRVCSNCGTVFHIVAKPPHIAGVCDVCGGKVVQRADDSESVVETRLDTYLKNTSPLKEYYRKSGQLVEILGTGDVGEIQRKIKGVIA